MCKESSNSLNMCKESRNSLNMCKESSNSPVSMRPATAVPKLLARSPMSDRTRKESDRGGHTPAAVQDSRQSKPGAPEHACWYQTNLVIDLTTRCNGSRCQSGQAVQAYQILVWDCWRADNCRLCCTVYQSPSMRGFAAVTSQHQTTVGCVTMCSSRCRDLLM